MDGTLNVHSFTSRTLQGQELNLGGLVGKVILFVNVASKCGFTPQYAELQALYDKYKDQGFEILAYPCNQFGSQEPGGPEEIENFCKANYGVTFKVMEKVEVNGDNVDPVWHHLKNKITSLGMTRIKWNFEKFLVDKKGNVRERWSSISTPKSLENDIEQLLKEDA